jgi:hypothetical protein
MFLLLISSLVSGNFAFASTEEQQFPQSIIAALSTDTTPHALELRAIQDGDNAEPRKVSQFKLDMTNVVTAQVNSQLLVFVTDNSVRVLEAKVRTVSDQLIDLVPTIQANAFSLANLPVGVYTLDIITQKENAKAAYEGILVINQQLTTIINETTKQIINQEINQNSRVDIDTKIIFKDNRPKSKPPVECPDYGYTVIDGKCVRIDETLGTLICDENTPPGTTCMDEADPDDCEEGFVDRGFGCVPEEEDANEEKEPCTPDGPPCPPCPEGIEAGWCADKDEQQDAYECPDEKPGDECYVDWTADEDKDKDKDKDSESVCDGSDVCDGDLSDGADGAIPMEGNDDSDEVSDGLEKKDEIGGSNEEEGEPEPEAEEPELEEEEEEEQPNDSN